MVDISKAKPLKQPIKVEASDNIFQELGNNTYDFPDLISELIDNSIAARRDDILLEVQIYISFSSDKKKSYLIIRDNASGIFLQQLGKAISPAALQGKGLNEHGLGMKQAIASLGRLSYLLTKTIDEQKAILIEEFKYGDIFPKSIDVEWEHGTEIKVHNLKPIVYKNPAHYTRDVVRQLGARYRRFLLLDAQKMKIALQLMDGDDGDKVIHTYDIELVKPIYFHPNTRNNKPVIEKEKFTGKGWEAELTFGYAPEEKEYEELGLPKLTKFDPYNVSQKNQGFDIIRYDRVIKFHALSEINLVDAKHPNYNLVKGEVDLKKGFLTAITKNSIVHDEKFEECLSQLKERLEPYLRRKTYPDEIPEKVLRDRLANWLKNNPLAKKKDVQTEYGVQALGGDIDILADNEVWEIKRDEAKGLDVYQLFAYLDMGNFNKGYLLAKGFSTGAKAAAKHICEKHKKEIILTSLDEYPITHALTDEEREQYF